MFRYRYSVRMLIAVVTLVAVYFQLARFYDSWFASTYSQYYISSVLGYKICNGDSFNQVASHFDSHQLVGPDHQLGIQSVAEFFASNNWPIEEGDQIFRFSTPGDGGAVYLQFRNNGLINLKNSTYADASLLAKMNGQTLPNAALTRGFLPIYSITVLILLVLYSFYRGKRQYRLPSTSEKDSRKLGADLI